MAVLGLLAFIHGLGFVGIRAFIQLTEMLARKWMSTKAVVGLRETISKPFRG